MKQMLITLTILALLLPLMGFAQTNEWMTQYVTLDDASNGTGYRTASVAVMSANRFVALVTGTPTDPQSNLFDVPSNYLVAYWDADSATGRIPSPINGQQTQPMYNIQGQYTNWTYILDQVNLQGAWQICADDSGYIYVANNDPDHNILVFKLTDTELVGTAYRMITGTENIYAIEVDENGYVYVVDYEGSDTKTDEVKVYAGIHAPGTTWGVFGGHNDSPVATIDLPAGIYQGITVNDDGTEIYISASSQRSILKYVGSPTSGYTQDTNWNFTLAADDTVGNGGHGTPTVLGLAYLNDPQFVCAAVDTFLGRGLAGGYSYGRIYIIDANAGVAVDTIDIAEWNLAVTGAYDSGSNNGRAGGYASVMDVDADKNEPALYTQTYYGWAAEKWIFDGDLHVLGIERVNNTVPTQYELKQNYPNPFNPVTTIEFNIRKTGLVRLEVYNVAGQKVATLVNQQMTPGTYKIQLDASHLPSGMYFYQLVTGDFRATKKMILNK